MKGYEHQEESGTSTYRLTPSATKWAICSVLGQLGVLEFPTMDDQFLGHLLLFQIRTRYLPGVARSVDTEITAL